MLQQPMNAGALAGMRNSVADGQLCIAQNSKELGMIQRIENVRKGIEGVHTSLRALVDRIGGRETPEANQKPVAAGIPANLAICEAHLQEIHHLIMVLETAF